MVTQNHVLERPIKPLTIMSSHEFKFRWSCFWSVQRWKSCFNLMESYKSKKSCLKRWLVYWADQNFKEERTYRDKKGLISALICNNKGETVACFLNPCSPETLHLGLKIPDDSEQIIQPMPESHQKSLHLNEPAWQNKGKYRKKKLYELFQKMWPGRKNDNKKSSWPSPKSFGTTCRSIPYLTLYRMRLFWN